MEDILDLTVNENEIPRTPGRENSVEEERWSDPVDTPPPSPPVTGLPPTPGRNLDIPVYTRKQLSTTNDLSNALCPKASLDMKLYDAYTNKGVRFEISHQELSQIPYKKIRQLKRKCYTIFMGSRGRVKLKIIKSKLIWYSYKEKS